MTETSEAPAVATGSGAAPEPPLRDVGADAMASLRRTGARAFAWLERCCERPRWRPVAVLLILLVALTASFPSLDAVGGDSWDSVQEVGRQPFTDLDYEPDSHASKNLYRVTVPIVGEALGLSPAGYMVLQALFGIISVYALLVVLERASGDRVSALLLTLAASLTYAGVVSFVEVRGIFDGVALALLLIALAWPRPWVIAPLVFLAGWTDERALFASGFLFAYFAFEQAAHLREVRAGRATDQQRSRTAQLAAVLVGVAAYGLSRLAVVAVFDLPQETGGVGPEVLLDQINNIAVGVWTGLEGLWIALVLAVFLMWRAQLRLLATFTVAVTGFIAVFAVSVIDITRSMGYLLPSVALSALVMGTMLSRRHLRRVALGCLALCAVWPVYYVGGPKTIWWVYPLPVQLFRFVTGAGA